MLVSGHYFLIEPGWLFLFVMESCIDTLVYIEDFVNQVLLNLKDCPMIDNVNVH